MVPVLLLGAAGCAEDQAGASSAPQEVYDEEAARLCVQHGPTLAEAYNESRPDSDAEEAAFYTSDVVPRARAIVTRLADVGFPNERRAEYEAALNDVLRITDELATQPFQYIDRRQAQLITPDEGLVVRLQRALAAADVPC